MVFVNVHRRHLQSGQAAACWKKREKVEAEISRAVECVRADAKKESRKRKPAKSVRQTIAEQKSASPDDRKTDAKRAGGNPQYIYDAHRLDEEAPDLLEEVADGKKSMPQAKRES